MTVKWVILSWFTYFRVILYRTDSEVVILSRINYLPYLRLSTIEITVKWVIILRVTYLRVIHYRSDGEVAGVVDELVDLFICAIMLRLADSVLDIDGRLCEGLLWRQVIVPSHWRPGSEGP